MIQIRHANERGRTDLGWLDSRHTFSFGRYYDPAHEAFGLLRVINDDRVTGGGGFGEHGHRDMEIISYVLSGALRHGDSIGHQEDIGPGDVQVMTAGSGIRHREFNASPTEAVHFLQIWIEPRATGLKPRYDQRHFDRVSITDQWRLIVSPDGSEGSLMIHQDARIHVAQLSAGKSLPVEVAAGRRGWVQVALGGAKLGEHELKEGDGAAITGRESLQITGGAGGARVLFFELP
jgi:redox-sensitive bicupin YhaK (pirin superfamily)